MNMRIAYGVMGYGRGHATRSAAVLPALMAEHDVTVLAGGDAHDFLAPHFPTVRIPMIGYVYGDNGSYSVRRTVWRNAPAVSDLLFNGRGLEQVRRILIDRKIDLVISDSEAWTHRAAASLGLPRISFDHVGVIAWCKPHFPPDLWLTGRRDAWAYRLLMGEPDRILISSFYDAEPARPGVEIVGPILREAVGEFQPREGDYLLAYFNKGDHQYNASLDRILRSLDCPVAVYGTSLRGRAGRIEFKAPAREGFLRDLAGCQALLSTAGNQLVGEAMHFRKPILALPEDAFEQRLNAHMIERMGIGLRARRHSLTLGEVDHFLGRCDEFRARMTKLGSDGRLDAIATLRRYIRELSGSTQSADNPWKTARPPATSNRMKVSSAP